MTEKKEHKLKVSAGQSGMRIDKFLSDYELIGSRSHAQKLIEAGHVLVDKHEVSKSERVRTGSTVDVSIPIERAHRFVESAHFKVAYEDPYLTVIDKPAGMVVHPAPSYKGGPTLVEVLAAGGTGEGAPAPRLVHRLDKDTSGLLTVAWDLETQRLLQRMIRKREISRNYLALAEGRLDAHSGTIDAPLGRDVSDRSAMSTHTTKPRSARTHFEVKEFLENATFMEVRLETGRTHQVRAHFAAIGHPLAGDPKYGHRGLFGLERQFLHSHRLYFDHPRTGERVDLESELPDDLVRALSEAHRLR